MSKKIEEIIALHNDLLNESAAEDIYLQQRIKARCRQAEAKPPLFDSLNLRFVKLVTTYAFLFFILVFVNFILINSLKDRNTAPKITGQEMDVFMAAVPGSITSAFTEVSQWGK